MFADNQSAFKCLQYENEHGCPWNEYTCIYSARHGYLECLRYAYEHGCPWNNQTCAFAAQYGQLEFLQLVI